MPTTKAFITHGHQNPLNIPMLEQALESKSNLSISLEDAKILLKQLSEFDLGRFMLAHRGLNGYWTAYLIIHGPTKKNLHPLEHWIIHHSPIAKATRERFQIFKQQLQHHLKSNMCIASIPCGLMDDLLTLDYHGLDHIELIGIDLDPESIDLARKNAQQYPSLSVSFSNKDAWLLGTHDKYDIITSNGLNIYEQDDTKVIALYMEFFNALKPGGLFITSFLTPPPGLSSESSWENYQIADLHKQKTIFSDIINASWQAFRTESTVRAQLETAGFHVKEVIYDLQRIFPTVIAYKKKEV